jgi:diguanylate cyclase (GGDEF)-like protein
LSTTVAKKNRRLLVIDDNEAIHKDFKKILVNRPGNSVLSDLEMAVLGTGSEVAEAIEYQIDTASQGQEGFEKVSVAIQSSSPFAVAFVDMRMPPGWDGLETIENIWKIDPAINVVICTAYSDYEWDDIIKRFGMCDRLLLLKKPFDSAEVRQFACALTEKWNLASQAALKMQELEHLVESRTSELHSINVRLQDQITQTQAAERHLREVAWQDPLTGLPNRVMLMERLDACVTQESGPTHHPCAVLFLDVDNFKVINDSLSHAAGDQLLVQIASRIKAAVRSGDGVYNSEKGLTARLGGDEFVVLLENLGSAADAEAVAGRMAAQLSAPFIIDGHELFITTSIGITLTSARRKSAADLLRDADIAMYHAKASGKARYAVFDESMHAAAVSRLTLENDLRRGIDEQQFFMEYQPIVELQTAAIVGFEALARWNHPTRGRVMPNGFIPMAEETGLIVPLGRWALIEVCRQSREWNDQRPPDSPIYVTVNISRRQLLQTEFVDEVHAAFHETGANPAHVKFEITENVIMDHPAPIIAKMNQLDKLGIELYMDDFGTGQSSLGCLHSFPFDVLKIDRGFVNSISRDNKYVAIIHAIINLAHNLNMKIVAEGLETRDQLSQLLALNCDYGQGYLFSHSLEATAAWALLDQPLPEAAAACAG